MLIGGGAVLVGAAYYFGWLSPNEASAAETGAIPTYDLSTGEIVGYASPVETASPAENDGSAEPSWLGSLSDFLRGGGAALPDTTQGLTGGSMRFSGRVGQLPPYEQSVIAAVAAERGIDPVLLGALRLAENGGPQTPNPNYPRSGNPYRGGEFGIQTIAAPTFGAQAEIAINTIRNTIAKYQTNTGRSATAGGKYTADFLRYFSQGGPGYGGYAPTGADPLNAFHYQNLLAAYQGSEVVTV